MIIWPEYWWRNIAGPSETLADIAGYITGGSVVLIVPDDLPWRHTLRALVTPAIEEVSADKTEVEFEEIDIADEWDESVPPGRFILEKYAFSKVITDYRPSQNIQKYIIQNNVLKNKVVWLKGFSKNSVDTWISFVSNYNSDSIAKGLFVLEIPSDLVVSETGAVSVVNYCKSVTEYDVQLFNSIRVKTCEPYNDIWKHYSAALASCLCGTDVEISNEFLSNAELMTDEPLKIMQYISVCPEYLRRGARTDDHVLSVVRRGDDDEFNSRVWKAQLQVLFPLVESERLRIIEAHKKTISEGLMNGDVKQYGDIVSDPYDVEIGTLDWMLKRRDAFGGWYVELPKEVVSPLRERVGFLRECRNRLAHGNICTTAMVAELIAGNQYY